MHLHVLVPLLFLASLTFALPTFDEAEVLGRKRYSKSIKAFSIRPYHYHPHYAYRRDTTNSTLPPCPEKPAANTTTPTSTPTPTANLPVKGDTKEKAPIQSAKPVAETPTEDSTAPKEEVPPAVDAPTGSNSTDTTPEETPGETEEEEECEEEEEEGTPTGEEPVVSETPATPSETPVGGEVKGPKGGEGGNGTVEVPAPTGSPVTPVDSGAGRMGVGMGGVVMVVLVGVMAL
ncbi:hypothetical protein BJ508DRAFT_373884 [Ascobolus immersus RN42]|uniref:Uncharacterized protein n=1 Tax=Ascobolus immersus RN42 TaxID=1160509 RepID=A0A3N4IUB4_ASCIM|nr:hypothetical protein BJ508DRAFT_373884 [Ascobolus immersus RN42]